MDNEQRPKPRFMTLPFEVRLIIINILAQTPPDPPSTPLASQQDYHLLKKGDRYLGRNGMWQRPPLNPVLNTMLVNRKLCEEVKFCLQTVPERYHLDVMNLKTYGLWTTWSIIKVPTQQYIETVSCTFRLFEPTPDLDDRFADSVSFRGSDGGPPPGTWAFCELLTGLFIYDPGYCTRSPDKPRFVVGTIVVDFWRPRMEQHTLASPNPSSCSNKASRDPAFRLGYGRADERIRLLKKHSRIISFGN